MSKKLITTILDRSCFYVKHAYCYFAGKSSQTNSDLFGAFWRILYYVSPNGNAENADGNHR